ncbi:MAG: hypothetical protein QOF24_979 [Verrucomicrobiota bacterium]
MIDVGRNTVDLRGEGYWFARNVDEVARLRTELSMVSALTMSVWQAAKYVPPLFCAIELIDTECASSRAAGRRRSLVRDSEEVDMHRHVVPGVQRVFAVWENFHAAEKT